MGDEKTLVEKIGGYIKSVLEFLLSDEDQDNIPLVVEWGMMVVQIIGAFKNPMELTEAEKRQAARILLEFGKHVSIEQLQRMIEIKQTGAMDNLMNATMDIVLGDVTARYMTEKYEKARATPRDGATKPT